MRGVDKAHTDATDYTDILFLSNIAHFGAGFKD